MVHDVVCGIIPRSGSMTTLPITYNCRFSPPAPGPNADWKVNLMRFDITASQLAPFSRGPVKAGFRFRPSYRFSVSASLAITCLMPQGLALLHVCFHGIKCFEALFIDGMELLTHRNRPQRQDYSTAPRQWQLSIFRALIQPVLCILRPTFNRINYSHSLLLGPGPIP